MTLVDASTLQKLSDHHWGWHDTHFSRQWEHPWVIRQIDPHPGQQVLDAGAGRSPLPLFCADARALVTTVDNGALDEAAGWGYVDYSELNPTISSFNMDFCCLSWARNNQFDVIYSVSVMEHLRATDRQRAWAEFYRILKIGGKLILTIDLQVDGFGLWNRSRGLEVEPVAEHGHILTILQELKEAAFSLKSCELCPLISDRVRIAGLILAKEAQIADKSSSQVNMTTRGHLKHKYDENYFLGGTESETGSQYSVLGHAEFRVGSIHSRLQEEFQFTRSVVGSLSGKDVLEIGFGRGDSIPLFLSAGVGSYTGFDFSGSAVDIARAHFNNPRVHLFEKDATELNAESAFDLIALYDCLEHIPVYEMEIVWPSIHRALRRGGYVVISTPIFDNPNCTDHSDPTPAVSGMHCHKQTWGTLLRATLKHGFTVAATSDRTIIVVRAQDLPHFDSQSRQFYFETQASLLARYGVTDFISELTHAIERKLVPGIGRVAIGCVAENRPKYLSQALRLLQSIRWFGSSLAGANVFIGMVDEIDPDYRHEFEQLGAFVRVIPRFSQIHAHSNKLRLFDLPELRDYDTVMLLDCDTLIVQDPSPNLDGDNFQAKIADMPTVPHDTFVRLFENFGYKMLKSEYICTDGTSTIWYCNAGVLIFPQMIWRTLGPVWRDHNVALLERINLLDSCATFCEQASLTLAFAAHPVPFKELPAAMNFPLHISGPSTPVLEIDPIILHYHDQVDASGFLLPSSSPKIQARIQQFNERLHEEWHENFNLQTDHLDSGDSTAIETLTQEVVIWRQRAEAAEAAWQSIQSTRAMKVVNYYWRLRRRLLGH